MTKTLELQMTTPEKIALQAKADFVVLPALKGEMGILPGHEPFLVQLHPGEVRVTSGEDVQSFAVSGGFAEVKDDKVLLFAETAEMANAIDAERARQALEKAKTRLTGAEIDPLSLAQAEAAIRRAQVRLRVSQLSRGHGRNRPAPETHD